MIDFLKEKYHKLIYHLQRWTDYDRALFAALSVWWLSFVYAYIFAPVIGR